MKFIIAFISILFLLNCIVSCSTIKKIEALKPEPSNDLVTVFKNQTSFVSLPIEIHLMDIQKQLNKNLTGLIYEDDVLEDDNTKLKIWKTSDIVLEEINGVLFSKVPLKILATVKYGTDFLGLNDTRNVYLDGVITLKSKTHLYSWKLTTKSEIYDFEWNESPSVEIAGKRIPITYLINPAISIFKKKIASQIDEAINKTCEFDSYVLDALEKISKPILVNESYETWFKLEPIELYVKQAELKNRKITMEMGLKCIMQTMIGQEPLNNFNKKNIILKPVSSMPDKVSVSLAAVSTYESASGIITKNFKGQIFGTGKRTVIVQKVKLWEKEGKLIIALDLLGSLSGTIYLSGFPKYNSLTNEIYFEELDYVLNTKNVLLKSANWLAQKSILNKIKENCKYSIKENLELGRKNMLFYLNNHSPIKGVYVNGILNDLIFEKVELSKSAIIAFITTTGKVKISIEGMD